MSEDGAVDIGDVLPPPGTHMEQDEISLQDEARFIGHVLNIGNGLVKELRFSNVDWPCNVFRYLVERMSAPDIIGIADELMKTRVAYLSDICDNYRKLRGNFEVQFAINFIRAMIAENFEWIDWEYENFASANEWSKPRSRKYGDTQDQTLITAPTYDIIDKFGCKDWLFTHQRYSWEPLGWWQGHMRVYRQRLIFGKAVKKPTNWDYEGYNKENRKKRVQMTVVEENRPSPTELICSFVGIVQNALFQEIRIRYTNDMMDFEVPDVEALIDRVRALCRHRQLKTDHSLLWKTVSQSINKNNVKYVYALFKKGLAALERFEDENTHVDNKDWNSPATVPFFLQYFTTIHFETTVPVPMTERRDPLVVQSGLDFMNKFSGSLNQGSASSEPSFNSRPLTESDLYPSETHAADGGQNEGAVENGHVESQPKAESQPTAENQPKAQNQPKTESHLQAESQPEQNSTGTTVKNGSAQNKEEGGNTEVVKKLTGKLTTTNSQIAALPVAEPVAVPALTTCSTPLPTSPVVLAPPKSATEVSKEVTIIKKSEEVEPVTLIAKPALSYAKVVKKTAGESEEAEKKSKASEPAVSKLDSGINETQVGLRKENEDNDGSEWTKVVSKSHENRSQKNQKSEKKDFQHAVASTVSHKKVLRSLDSKDTDETSSSSSSSADVKSQNGNSKCSGNGKQIQPASKNGNTSPSSESSQKTSSGNSSESEKHVRNVWGQSPVAEKKDAEPPSIAVQPEEQQPPKLTKTAMKKAKKAAAAAAAEAAAARATPVRVPNVKRLFSDQESEAVEPVPTTIAEAPKSERPVTPVRVPNVKVSDPETKAAEPAPKTEKLVMVADDDSEVEVEFEVNIKESKSTTSKVNNKKKTPKKGAGTSRQGKKLTTVEAHITDKTASLVLDKALKGVLKKEGLYPSWGEKNQEANESSTSSNISSSARNRQDKMQSQVVHDYRPGAEVDDGESSSQIRNASPESLGKPVEPPDVDKNVPVHDKDLNDKADDELEVEEEVDLANPEIPIKVLAGCPKAHEMFVNLKYFSDYRKQLAGKNDCFNRNSYKQRAERFELAYLFRLRIAKAMSHIKDGITKVEAVTTREDSTTRILLGFLQEPIENQNSLRGQNLDCTKKFENEAQDIREAFRFFDLRMAELGQENELGARYQQICNRLLAVVREQNSFYSILARFKLFKEEKKC